MKLRLSLIAVTALAIPLSAIKAPFPDEQFLQHIPTVAALVLIAIAVPLIRPSSLSFTCMLTFLWLHILGACWIYSFVPYDEWARRLTGTTLSDYFGWSRNHYDRMVHAASGLLGVPPASEMLQRFGGMRPIGAAVMSIATVLAVGAIYEILEWQIAISFSPARAEAYNGQQGDVWDPQKDLALAGLGALVAFGLVFRWSPRPSR